MIVVGAATVGCGSHNNGTRSSPSSAGRQTVDSTQKDSGESEQEPLGNDSDDEGEVQLSEIDIVAANWLTSSEQRLVVAAWEKVYADCAAAAGYSVTEHTIPETDADRDAMEIKRMLFNDVDLISQHGYHWLRPSFQEDADASNVETTQEVEVDDSTDGRCVADANDRLGGEYTDELNFLLRQRAELAQQSQVTSNESLEPYREGWAECMATEGYPAESYTDPARVQKWLSNDETTPAEVTYALADSKCRGESGLREALISKSRQQTASWNSQHPTIVAEYAATTDAIVDQAKHVLGR